MPVDLSGGGARSDSPQQNRYSKAAGVTIQPYSIIPGICLILSRLYIVEISGFAVSRIMRAREPR